LWKVINDSQLLSHTFPEDLKLAEIAVIHILGSVVDERCFNSVSFLKTKLQNQLKPHLQLVALYAQKKITLQNFAYVVAFESWANVMTTNGQGWHE
jgi:hypothetical protein